MTAVRHGGKSAGAFRTISEVADDLDVPQHVLRFWETKFSQVRPLKRGGGRRYYRPEDVELLRHIRDLLYTDGYTIKGVQRLLRESGGRAGAGATAGTAAEVAAGGEGEEGLTAAQRKALTALRDELLALRELLKSVGS
jgi:DNA-binding transcriptional MerR regulator